MDPRLAGRREEAEGLEGERMFSEGFHQGKYRSECSDPATTPSGNILGKEICPPFCGDIRDGGGGQVAYVGSHHLVLYF